MRIDSEIQTLMPLPGAQREADLNELKNKSDAELRQASKDFEAMFMNIVLKEMRKTVPDSELLDGGNKIEFFQSMLDEEYSKMMKDSPNSLATQIYRNLSRILGREAQTEEVKS